MNDTSVIENTEVNQVSSRTPHVRAGINLVGFFIGDCQMKRIPLTQGQFALVDDAEFEELSQYKWHAESGKHTFYAVRTAGAGCNQKFIRMHRVIINAQRGQEVDHINGDGLLNIRSNLRYCTSSQNSQNRGKRKNCSSTYKGVSFDKRPLNKKWRAHIFPPDTKKLKSIGYYKTEIEAAISYDEQATLYFGEFARLNFPTGFF